MNNRKAKKEEMDCSPCEWLSVVSNFISLFLVGGGIVFAAYQTQSQAQALRTSAYTAVMDKQMEINKIFLEKTYLQTYFFDGILPSKDNSQCNNKKNSEGTERDCYREAQALSDYYLDFFDIFYTQRDSLLAGSDTPDRDCQTWERYITDRLTSSPILIERIDLAEKKGWYTPEFIRFLRFKYKSSPDELAQLITEECQQYASH